MENIEEKIMENNNKDKKGCKMTVNKSTKKIFTASRKCKDSKGNMELSVKMLNSKEGLATIKMIISPRPMKSKMTWVTSNCPKSK
jgi:hypothetical protein